MVRKQQYHNGDGSPPPPDESWWEAVLAEDEARSVKNASKVHYHVDNHRPPVSDTPVEQIALNWEQASILYDQDQVVNLKVTGYNRGGLLVSGDGLHGFVPISHLVEMLGGQDDPDQWLEAYEERTLTLKVIECDQERGRIVFSERAAQSQPGSRKLLLERLNSGDCIEGAVTNITDFGVFVDLGGVEGLVHVSEISWGRVQHPSDVVSLGDTVEVYVIQIDQERARVALSLKRLYPNPWETAQERYHIGQVTEAVVTSIVPFGAFARLEEGLDGLIHISEMNCNDGMDHPENILQEGQQIQVRILHVDAARQRMGLSLLVDDEQV